MFKAAIRVNKIKTIAQLRGASLHAERHDQTGKARVREGAEPGYGLAWSKAENDRDYLAAFKAHKVELGAGERKNAPLCMQALCVVSPEWVEKAGDLHDADNPHNRQLFDQAKAWAESWAGKDSVFGARLDLDEKGGAVVDLMISPVRASRGKPVISTQKALTELKGLTGERNEYSALQTSWADWCRDTLDASIVRGTRREITAREHLSPETYGLVMDKARESVREAPEAIMDAIRATDLSYEATEPLRDYLLLKGEISRHKTLGRAYEPPEGRKTLDDVEDYDPHRNAWPLIEAIREKAQVVMDISRRVGMSFEDNANDRYENGKNAFPSLTDRMHLSAVVAKCAAFCARAEAFVKNYLNPEGHQIDEANCWPFKANDEVQRHERNLGLRSAEVSHELEHSVERERGYDQTEEIESHQRDKGDYGLSL
ncbi:plasmid recombination protein [Epibacterium ulvae]|uniref:plasmid recombination protein n=1 Tax=Epibacterium ulvae TaxID=1156985 RepID=UPI00249052EC|nr:plasmid recombination protein [Epibacterium ulvae]